MPLQLHYYTRFGIRHAREYTHTYTIYITYMQTFLNQCVIILLQLHFERAGFSSVESDKLL